MYTQRVDQLILDQICWSMQSTIQEKHNTILQIKLIYKLPDTW